MEILTAGRGSIFNIEDQEGDSNSRHNYIVIGANPFIDTRLSWFQCMSITSMHGKAVTTEVPIILNNCVSYIVPYHIYSFKPYTLRTDSQYKGALGFEYNADEFAEMLLNIYEDVVIKNFKDKAFHSKVKKKYNAYIDNFYEQHHDAVEYRSTKLDGTDEKKLYTPVYYAGELYQKEGKFDDRIIATLSLDEEIPINQMTNDQIISYYDTLKSISCRDYKQINSEPASKRMFYNKRHRAKTELLRRRLISANA